MAVRLMLFLMFHLLHNAVSQVTLEPDVSIDPACPDTPVVFTCTVNDATVLRWLVTNGTEDVLLIQYVGSTPSLAMPLPGIEPQLISAEPGSGAGRFDYTSTLNISAASVLGDFDAVICDDGGTMPTEVRQTVERRSPPPAPQSTCTFPSLGTLRLTWTNVVAGDDVTMYLAGFCTGGGCPCVPDTECGDTTMCDRNLEEGEHCFAAVNSCDQRSDASTLTVTGVEAPAAPEVTEVRVRYAQSTGDLTSITATWNRMNSTVVATGADCNDEIQYTVNCDTGFSVDSSTNCDGSTCSYELSRSSECMLSVTARNAVGMTASTTSTIEDTTPLMVEVSDGTITCLGACSIMYGTGPNNRNLPATSGVQIPGLLSNETYFYLVTQTTGSQIVEVEGSFTLVCDCLDLTSRPLVPPPVCSGGGGTIPDAISNGNVTYTSLAVNSGRATYQCDEGFSISGDSTRECQGDGSWSGSPPTCQEEEEESSNIGPIVGGVVGGVVVVVFVPGVGVVVYIWRQDKSKGSSKKRPDRQELRERTTSADADAERAVAEDTAATYADPNTIERQEFPGTHDVYTMVDTKKKTPKPEEQLPTYQAPESIKREAAPTTGELYTVPENKKGSKKKKETTPPEYSQVDLQKKHQPPSGLLYSQLDLPPSGKTPAAKTVEYTDIKPHS